MTKNIIDVRKALRTRTLDNRELSIHAVIATTYEEKNRIGLFIKNKK